MEFFNIYATQVLCNMLQTKGKSPKFGAHDFSPKRLSAVRRNCSIIVISYIHLALFFNVLLKIWEVDYFLFNIFLKTVSNEMKV